MTFRALKKDLRNVYMALDADTLRAIYDNAFDSGSDAVADLTYTGLSRSYKRSCNRRIHRSNAEIAAVRAEARRRAHKHQDPSLLVQYVKPYVETHEVGHDDKDVPF